MMEAKGLKWWRRRVGEAVLRRTGVRWMQFTSNSRKLAADSRAGREHVGVIPGAGVRMIVHPQMYLRCAYIQRVFEPGAVHLLRDWLRSGDSFVDVGANVGLFSLLAAQCVGPTGRVWAFEPGGFVFDLLQRNCRLNGYEIACAAVALGERTGKILLNQGGPGYDAYTSIGTIVHRSAQGGSFRKVEVPLVRGDQWWRDHGGGRIRLLKVDVEGAELGVIKGFEGAFEAGMIDAVLIEITDEMSRACGYSTAEVWSLLEGHGFDWWTVDDFGRATKVKAWSGNEHLYVARRKVQ